MAKERLREDARLISSSDHTLGAPREDFERASIPTQPLKFPCPIQCSAWAVSILVGYCMEAIIFGIWSLSIRSSLEMTSVITLLVFVLALILAVFALIVVGSALQRMHRGSITAFLIIAISPVMCGLAAIWAAWPLAEHFYYQDEALDTGVDPMAPPAAIAEPDYLRFLNGTHVNVGMTGRDRVYSQGICAAPIMTRSNESTGTDVYYWAIAIDCCPSRFSPPSCRWWDQVVGQASVEPADAVWGGRIAMRSVNGDPPAHGAVYDAMSRYNLTQTADLSHVRLIFWEPDPRVARKHRVHIGLAVFSVMPLLAPFVAIYATSFLTPHATYDRDTSSYPLKWIVGTRDPAML